MTGFRNVLRCGRRTLAGMAAGVVLALPALAADLPVVQTAAPPPPPITGALTVYGWLPALDGSLSNDRLGITKDFSASAADLLENLKFAAFASGTLTAGRFSVLADLVYTSVGGSESVSGPFDSRVSGNMKLLLLTGFMGYRPFATDRAFLDILAGGRFNSADIEVRLMGGGPLGVSREATTTETWFDPLVGFRAGYSFTDRWSARLIADIGGFSLGSDLTWEVIATAVYSISPSWSAEAGFRYLSIDYDGDRANVDVDMFGPILGLSWRF